MDQSPESVTTLRISPSRITCYQDCPKKYDYVYRQNLQPKSVQRVAFDKGNYCHELLHVYYQMIQSGAEPGSEFTLHSMLSRIRNDLSRANNTSLIPIYASITKTMTRFITEQSATIDKGITVLGVEHEIDIPISASGRNFSLFGFIDLVYRDRDGRLRIRDHKTGQKPWTKAEANNSNQLLFYSAATYKSSREVPMAEISFMNVKDYVRKAPVHEQMFAFPTVTYTETELSNYLTTTLHLIEQMITSEPVPHYGRQCTWCPFLSPCILDRKGVDNSPMLENQYTVVDRSQVRKHVTFTENYSTENGTD
ncbi:MAG: PD-(D/E)XK nuclease family protein [Paenisporosarcina sp.]